MKPVRQLAIVALFWALPAAGQDLFQPAELPPAGYKGQQYVDSEGCVFLRTGGADRPAWFPRVTREGRPICGYPPSGTRVPLAGAETEAAQAPPKTASAPKVPVAPGGFLVAIGSYDTIANADRDERKLTALGLPVHRGTVVRRGVVLVTVFAGPFNSAAEARAARKSLRDAGFDQARVVRY